MFEHQSRFDIHALSNFKTRWIMNIFCNSIWKNFSTFKRTVMCLVAAVVEVLENKFVLGARDSCCTMKKLLLTERCFQHNPFALYATHVKFHHSNRPHGSHQKCKLNFSDKHRLYGYETKVSVSLSGPAIFISPYFSKFKSDSAIFRALSYKHKIFTLKRSGENEVNDEEYASHSWSNLFDK